MRLFSLCSLPHCINQIFSYRSQRRTDNRAENSSCFFITPLQKDALLASDQSRSPPAQCIMLRRESSPCPSCPSSQPHAVGHNLVYATNTTGQVTIFLVLLGLPSWPSGPFLVFLFGVGPVGIAETMPCTCSMFFTILPPFSSVTLGRAELLTGPFPLMLQ